MKLLFIYNANSGNLNALFDAVHKLISPKTYKCSLCTLTYDTFTENTIWKNFRTESQFEMEFYHKDEFEAKFDNINLIYPTVVKLKDNALTTILSPDILNEISDVEALIERLKTSI